jgi:L-threonylcarbamoyladenylate synthase
VTLAPEELERLVCILRGGGVVACPTETFVGLLADATNARAVERVVALKGRDAGQPMGVLVPELAALSVIVGELPPRARALAEQHWPGPLTLVLRARPGLPRALLRDGKIGVRVPGPSPALELVRAFGAALTATSANRSGEPPARTSDEAARIFGRALDAIVSGAAPGGLASTVIDATTEPLRVIRQGAVALPT